jgi:hypothetical protein
VVVSIPELSRVATIDTRQYHWRPASKAVNELRKGRRRNSLLVLPDDNPQLARTAPTEHHVRSESPKTVREWQRQCG